MTRSPRKARGGHRRGHLTDRSRLGGGASPADCDRHDRTGAPGQLVADRVLWNNRLDMCIKSSAGFLVSLVVLLAVPVIAQTAPGQNAIEEQASARAEAYRLFLLGRHLAGEDDIEGAVRSYREASQRDLESGESP